MASNSNSCSENRVKFAFNFKLIKPHDDDETCYSFEEIRARHYYKQYELLEKMEAKYKEKLAKLEQVVKEKDEALKALEQEKQMTVAAMSQERARIPKSSLKRASSHGSVTTTTTMFANGGADYTTGVDNFTNVTQFDHITANVSTYHRFESAGADSTTTKGHRGQMSRVNFTVGQDDSALAMRSMCPLPGPPPEIPSICDTDGLTAKLDRIRKTEHTMFCDEPESVDTPPTSRSNKTVTINTFQARKAMENMFSNLNKFNDDTLEIVSENTAPVAVRPDSICIHNDDSLIPAAPKMLSQADFSVFGDVSTKEPEKEKQPDAAKKPAVQTGRKPLQVLATNPDCSAILNESGTGAGGDSYENTPLFGGSAHTAKIEFEPPAASTRNLRPMLQHIREQGGFKPSKMFSPNERPLHTIIDDSLELSTTTTTTTTAAAGINDPPTPQPPVFVSKVAVPTSSGWQGGADSVIVEGRFEKSAIKHSLPDDSIKMPEMSQDFGGGFTEALIPRHLAEISNHREFDDPTTYQLRTKKIKGSKDDNGVDFEYDYQYMSIQHNKSEDEFGNNKESMMIIPDIQISDLTAELMKTSASTTTQGEEVTAAEVMPPPGSDTNNLLTTETYEQSFKLHYRICCDPSMLSEASANKSSLKGNLEQLHDMSILMKGLVAEDPLEDEELERHEQLPTNKTTDLTRLRMSFNHTAMVSPAAMESMLGDETLNGDGEMNASSLNGATRTVPLNDTIVKSVQNPFNFDVKNRLLNRSAIEYLKKKPNYASVMVKGPQVREKAIVAIKDSFKVISEIGKGAYAKIYLIEPVKQDNKDKRKQLALKVDTNSTAWEFYITETIHDRLQKLRQESKMRIDVTSSFVKMHDFVKYSDGCLSTMNYYKNGSLLDLINYHVRKNENFPYWFVIYLTLEMLNIVDYLHKCQIIHADIKPDNLLINQLPNKIEYFDPSRSKCLVLIDFNRSIDLNLLPEEAEFEAQTDNKSLLCCEMKAKKPWTYQIDFFGVMSSIHCIIFKKYMNTYRANDSEAGGGRNRITNTIPRTFDKLFADFFDTFLNIPSCQELPSLEKDWITKFEKLFKNELGASFHKFDKYLKALNSTDLHKI